MITTRPRGTNDILPSESHKWQHITQQIHDICALYGFRQISTPAFEHTELFHRGVGEGTDIVQKETYTFEDRGGRSLTLRAEGTAPTARAYLENGLHAAAQPTKLYYIEPIFRFERPQAGRYRQHHQFGVEVFGAADPAVDVEVIALALDFLGRFGLDGLTVRLNSVGCPTCRESYRARLVEHFLPCVEQLCPDCRSRIERNPLRLLDCKEEGCRRLKERAPHMLDSLCGPCREHFVRLRGHLDALGIRYEVDHHIVRGLDYYTRTVFEIIYPGLGAQDAVCGGGRYDGLIETLGGEPTPGVGFGMGLERLILTLEDHGYEFPGPRRLDVFLAAVGQEALARCVVLLAELRRRGVAADTEYTGRGLRKQMKHADRLGARFVAIVGEEELATGRCVVRDMGTGTQEDIALEELAGYIQERCGRAGL